MKFCTTTSTRFYSRFFPFDSHTTSFTEVPFALKQFRKSQLVIMKYNSTNARRTYVGLQKNLPSQITKLGFFRHQGNMPLISDEQLSFACNQSIILSVSGSDAPRNNESKMLANRTRTKTSHSNYGCILSRMRLHFCLKVYQIPGCRRFGYAALRCRTRRILTCIRFSSNFLIYSSTHACT